MHLGHLAHEIATAMTDMRNIETNVVESWRKEAFANGRGGGVSGDVLFH